MSVPQRHSDIRVSKKLADRADVYAGHDKTAREMLLDEAPDSTRN